MHNFPGVLTNGRYSEWLIAAVPPKTCYNGFLRLATENPEFTVVQISVALLVFIIFRQNTF